ncbi:hypothetical protein [Streptomyces sp. 8N616]|uniref:hypothetical protein n=1 Tax=Streptomyces sp. 8N616 TaxID=3457414 RepID=UPI003FD0D421
MERIVRTDFRKLHGFSKAVALPLLPARVWTAAEWDRIQLGYRAQGMDERWNAFAEGNRLFLHSSWTGHRIYEAVFAPAPGADSGDGQGRHGDGLIISGALVEGDPRRHRRTSDAYDAVMLEVLVGSVLLGERSGAGRQRLTELRGGADSGQDAGQDAEAAQRLSALGLRTADEAPEPAR